MLHILLRLMPQLVPHKSKENALAKVYKEVEVQQLSSPTYIGLFYVIYSLHYFFTYYFSIYNFSLLNKFLCMFLYLLFLAWSFSVGYLSLLYFLEEKNSQNTFKLSSKWFYGLISAFVLLILSYTFNYIYLYLISENLVQDLNNLINETYDINIYLSVLTCIISLFVIYKLLLFYRTYLIIYTESSLEYGTREYILLFMSGFLIGEVFAIILLIT